jgi:parallel beta helix pectate lyase-like protein/pectate lyase-like protein
MRFGCPSHVVCAALLLVACATLATNLDQSADIMAQPPQPTSAVSFHWTGSGLSIQPAAATAYYVAPDGADSHPGTEALPWQTIQKAANTMVAGDVAYIKTGIYHERVVPANSGTAGSPITYSAYPGHSPVVDGLGVPSGYRGLFEVHASYITISGLTVRHSAAAAIHVRGSSDIIIQDNRTEESASSGIGVWRSSDIVVDGNVVVNAKNAPTASEECITIASVDRFEVKGNQVYSVDNGSYTGAGIDVKESSSYGKIYKNTIHDLPSSGVYIDAWDGYNHHHKIYQNHIYNTPSGISIGSERSGQVQYLDIYNNVIHHVSYAGIRLHRAGEDGLRQDIEIYNNTIVESDANGGAGILIETYNARNITLVNNLISFGPDCTCGQIKAYLPAEIVSVTNLVYGPHKPTQNPNLIEITAGTVEADPRLIDTAIQDFRLQVDSPAVDSGSDVSLKFDHDGVSRPQGQGHDIGAYELVPGLMLSGAPADRAIHLNWARHGISLPVTSTWRLDYQSDAGAVYPSIHIGTNSVLTYTIADLSNYVWYTVTLNAMLDSSPFLTDTVRVMPTDKFVHLPWVSRAH